MTATLPSLTNAVRKAATRFDGRSLRERLLMAGTALALAYAAGDQLWLAPALQLYRTATLREAAARTALATADSGRHERLAIELARVGALARERNAWRLRVNAGDEALRSHETALVGAEQMGALLERLVQHRGSLRLRRLQSLPRAEIGVMPAASSASAAVVDVRTGPAADASLPQLYRHGLDITIEGTFGDLLGYLRALEKVPQRLEWSGLVFKVERYPRAVMTLRLNTLSLDRHWIEL